MNYEFIYLGMSMTAQFLFAISAVPFWWAYRKSFHVFGLFEWTWLIAEILMIGGSVGLNRFDLIPGLVINMFFLALCLIKSEKNRHKRKQSIRNFREFLDRRKKPKLSVVKEEDTWK